jgi:SIR2-like domain
MNRLRELKNMGTNEFVLSQLVRQLKSAQGVLPFVGAGLSIPFGFKGWQQFLLTQAKFAAIEKKIKTRTKRGEYEEAAQDLLEALKPRRFEDALLSEYGRFKLDKVKTLRGTAVNLLPRLAIGPVITTNFDQVLEKAFDESSARFQRVVYGADAEDALQDVYSSKRCLLKLHGDVEQRAGRVLTLSEYQQAYGDPDPSRIDFAKPLPNLLRHLLVSWPVLFLGCSLKYDRVTGFLKQFAKMKPDQAHYAVLAYPGEGAVAEEERYFSELGIRPIWYPKGEHAFVEMIVRFLSKNMVDSLPIRGSRQEERDVVSVGMKATEALETLIRQHSEIASFFLVRYKDKLRLGERTDVRLADNPQRYLAQAAIHDSKGDEVEELPRTKLTPTFWKRLFNQLDEGFVLAASSRVRLKDGTISHIPMMDFKCTPTAANIDIAKEGFRKIDQTQGILLNSGKSFHYYGNKLMNQDEWHAFLGHSLLLSDFVDARYVGHALVNNECRLRISTTRLNPFIPTVVDIFSG